MFFRNAKLYTETDAPAISVDVCSDFLTPTIYVFA